jgi:hypothetical protein
MSVVNYPRVKLVVNGQAFAVDSTTVRKNGYYHGDKMECSLPLWGNGTFDNEWWIALGSVPIGSNDTSSPIPVLVYNGEGSPTGQTTWESEPLFDGLLLNKKGDIHTGKLNISCVDRTILLQQYKLYQTYPNKSGAEIISMLAQQVGMTANVTGADRLVGALYSKNHVKLQHGDMSKVSTAWDMICYLARESGNVAFVKGTVVYVQPNKPDASNAFSIIYGKPVVVDGVSTWSVQSNVKTLSWDHNLLMAKDITIEVQFFHSKKGKPGSAKAGPPKNKNASGQSNFIFGPYANMTADQAQAKANQLYKEYTAHEYTWTFEAPVDFTLQPYQTVLITDSVGEMAQTFYINELTYKVDADSGATMTVVAKTHPQENDTNA